MEILYTNCAGLDVHKKTAWSNAYVERFHRTYRQECLQVHQPSTLQEVREVTEAFLQHYNHKRPHQGILWECPSSCGVSNIAHLTSPPRAS